MSFMKTKKVIGTYNSIEDLLRELDVLKGQGYQEEELIAVVKNEEDKVLLQERTAIKVSEKSKSKSTDEQSLSTIEAIILLHDSSDVGRTESKQSTRKMDSRVEKSHTGEVVVGQDENQEVVTSPKTTPRINTTNL